MLLLMRSGRALLLAAACAAAFAAAACAAPLAAPPAALAAAPAPARPPVVVAIIVDQLAAWIANERLPLLPEDGGFARLRREGTWSRRMRFAHAVTDTGPGHAALHTADRTFSG
jgi:hypothetical protein